MPLHRSLSQLKSVLDVSPLVVRGVAKDALDQLATANGENGQKAVGQAVGLLVAALEPHAGVLGHGPGLEGDGVVSLDGPGLPVGVAAGHEITEAFHSQTSTTNTADGWKSWIVPSRHNFGIDKFCELSL